MKSLEFDLSNKKLTIKGEVTSSTLEKGFLTLKQILSSSQESTVLTVDWQEVSDIDSSCLALMLWLQSQQTEKIQLINLPERLQTLFDLYDLSSEFKTSEFKISTG